MSGQQRAVQHPILEPFYRLLADLREKVGGGAGPGLSTALPVDFCWLFSIVHMCCHHVLAGLRETVPGFRGPGSVLPDFCALCAGFGCIALGLRFTPPHVVGPRCRVLLLLPAAAEAALRLHACPSSPSTCPQIGDESGAAECRRMANAGRLSQRMAAAGGKQQQQRQQKPGGGRKGGSGASTARAGGRRV